MRRQFTDAEVMTRLRSNDTRQHTQALTDLYQAHGSMIIQLITQRQGSREDGEDTLSKALFIFFTNVRSGAFQLQPTTKISTYLGTLATNTWKNRVRKDKPWLADTVATDDFRLAERSQEEPVADERQELFWELVARLGGKCQALLRAVVEGFSMQEIALIQSFTNADNAKAHKYNCMKKLDALRTKQP